MSSGAVLDALLQLWGLSSPLINPPPPRLSTPASDSLERKSSPVVVPLPFPPQGHLVCREALDMSPVLWQGLWTLCSTPPPPVRPLELLQ